MCVCGVCAHVSVFLRACVCTWVVWVCSYVCVWSSARVCVLMWVCSYMCVCGSVFI